MVSMKRVGGIAAAVLVGGLVSLRFAGGRPSLGGPTARATPAWSLPAGQRATYEIAWVGHRQTPFGLGPAQEGSRDAEMRLVGEMTLDALPSGEGEIHVALALTSIARAEIRASDLPAGASDSAAIGLDRTACTVRGTLANSAREVHCTAATPAVGAAIVRDLAARVLPTVAPAATTWTADETTRDAVGEVQYQWLPGNDLERRRSSPREMPAAGVRSRGRFSCRGEARWTFHESGFPALFVEREDWSEIQAPKSAPFALNQRLELRLRSVAVLAGDSAHGGRVAAVAESSEAGDPRSVDDRLLDQRIGTMTLERALADLDGLGAGGRLADGAQWNVQVTGLLLRHPEYAPAFAGAFAKPTMNPTTRNRIMELLASVGSDSAQAAMVDALQAPNGQRDRVAWGAHLERFALLRAPATDETLAALDGMWSRATSPLERACAASALATAASSRLGDAGTRARAHLDGIAREARNATDSESKALLLRALGNARQPMVYEAVREAAKSSSTVVRAAAMTSLRHVDSDDARALLLAGVRDAAFNASADALESLREQNLTTDHLYLLSGKFGPSASAHAWGGTWTSRERMRD